MTQCKVCAEPAMLVQHMRLNPYMLQVLYRHVESVCVHKQARNPHTGEMHEGKWKLHQLPFKQPERSAPQ